MITGIHPIRIHGAQVLDLELDQGAGKLGLVTQLLRKRISLEFVLSAEDVHQELDDCVHRCKSVGEENEADYNWVFAVEPEGLVERVVVDEDGEQGEDIEEMCL